MKTKTVTVLYMPTINPDTATDLRFFIPYATSHIAEMVQANGYVVRFVDLNRAYWSEVTGGVAHSGFVAELLSGDFSNTTKNVLEKLVHAAVDGASPGIWLVGKDFFSCSRSRGSVQSNL